MDWLVAIPVWGDAYHALFARDIWPSIERALEGATGHVRFVFHTDDPAAIRDLIGSNVDAQFLWPNDGETWQVYSQSHREAASFARDGEAICFLNADIVVSEECFAAAEKRFAEGKRAVVMQATRTIGCVFARPPARARYLLQWSLMYAHNMARETWWPMGQSTVPCTITYTDGANVIMRAFFLHPFAIVKHGPLEFKGTVDQDALDGIDIDLIHVVTDPDEAALAEISLKLERRLPSLPHRMNEDTIIQWASGATSAHHKAFFKQRIVLKGSADTHCDDPAEALLARLKTAHIEQEVQRRWYKGAMHHAEGYMGKAVRAWGEAMDYQHRCAEAAGIPATPRYLADDWTGNIGHPTYLDMFAKGMKLGMLPEYVVLADMDQVSTPSYLKLWKPHIRIVSKRDYPHYWRMTREPTAVLKVDGKWQWFVDVHCEIEALWRDSGGKPLIRLPGNAIRKGWKAIGLDPKRDWFVCLHVRNSNDGQAGRDGDPLTYAAAADVIRAAGGHPIWIPTGDRELDIFLMAQARFVICSNAGPSLMAGTFGTPIIGANWYPAGIGYAYQPSIILPKRMKVHGRLIEFEEQLQEPWNHVQNPEVMAGLGIELVSNTQNMIADAAEEMIERTNGRADRIDAEDRAQLPA